MDTDTEKLHEQRQRLELCTDTWDRGGTPKTPGATRSRREARAGPSVTLGLRLLAFKTVKGPFLLFEANLLVVTCDSSARRLVQPLLVIQFA